MVRSSFFISVKNEDLAIMYRRRELLMQWMSRTVLTTSETARNGADGWAFLTSIAASNFGVVPIGNDANFFQRHQTLADHLVQLRQERLDLAFGVNDLNHDRKIF